MKLMLLALAIFQLVAAKNFLDGKPLPDNFVYGCAVAAYQVEGAWNEDGKGASIWDKYSHDGNCALNATGDVADDFYHTYKTDLALFKSAIGIGSFSFSIAWTRIFPKGRGEANQKGIQYYKDLIAEAKKLGLKTSCTLYHWDVPQSLYEEYTAFQSPKLVDDYRNYAKTMFNALGNTCDYWITFNEPKVICTQGYGPTPAMAPGLAGNRSLWYTCAHHLLLSHAAAVEEYKKTGLKAPVGIKLDHMPLVPFTTSAADKAAADRANDFETGWFVMPLVSGDYPEALKNAWGTSFPKFTAEQSKSLKGSLGFLGLDPYTAAWAQPTPNCTATSAAWPKCVNQFQTAPNGKTIGIPTGSSWNFLTAENSVYRGLRLLVDRYNTSTLPLWISETGMSQKDEPSLSLEKKTNDFPRIQWYRQTLRALQKLLSEKVPVTGFIPWACMDNMEWSRGYTERFGVIGVKYDAAGKGSQERFVKRSANYLKSVLVGAKPI